MKQSDVLKKVDAMLNSLSLEGESPGVSETEAADMAGCFPHRAKLWWRHLTRVYDNVGLDVQLFAAAVLHRVSERKDGRPPRASRWFVALIDEVLVEQIENMPYSYLYHFWKLFNTLPNESMSVEDGRWVIIEIGTVSRKVSPKVEETLRVQKRLLKIVQECQRVQDDMERLTGFARDFCDRIGGDTLAVHHKPLTVHDLRAATTIVEKKLGTVKKLIDHEINLTGEQP